MSGVFDGTSCRRGGLAFPGIGYTGPCGFVKLSPPELCGLLLSEPSKKVEDFLFVQRVEQASRHE